jgi:serine/threonine-protein kinase RsbT
MARSESCVGALSRTEGAMLVKDAVPLVKDAMTKEVPAPTPADKSGTSDIEEVRVPVQSDTDVIVARQQGRALAARLGFSSSDATIVATAISELARNIVLYAMRGEIVLAIENHNSNGPILVITARDEGKGIADLRLALQDGYSTSGRLGVGLPGVRRLMDEFEISSTVGRGTVVVVKKWKQ